MIVDNGWRRPLVIAEVFDGICGFSRGRVAFQPNKTSKRPEDARAGLLDGAPVLLKNIHPDADGRSYIATVEPFE